jgi:coenzyme Q-binding protein COQ10
MYVYETKHAIAHSAEDMFALVADIESYPKFLPLCEELMLKRREMRDGEEVLIAVMAVGYKLFRESFTTEVVLDREAQTIAVSYLDGPFSYLENRWRFIPILPERCEVDFYIKYSFRSRLLEHVMGGLFAKAVRKYTAAFEERADVLYGRTGALASQQAGE